MRRLDARFCLWGTALVLLLLLPVFAGFGGVGWELSQWAGLAGAVACIALAGAPMRARSSTPPTLVSLRVHTLVGWTALLGVCLHVVGLVLSDPTVVEYLKPTTPLYQLAGIEAVLVLLLLVMTGAGAMRRRLWKSHRSFQATHVVLGCVLAALIAVHVVVTARYIGGRGRRVLIVAATIGAILMLLRTRRTAHPGNSAHPVGTARKQLVFGRHSSLIVGAVAVCAAAVAGLFPDSVGAALREPVARRTTTLPLDFPHGKHGAVNCLTCHHNYNDGTGSELCIQCHRSNRTDLKEGIEARFHGFCFQCHRHPDSAVFTKHGPVTGCAACHRPPNLEQ